MSADCINTQSMLGRNLTPVPIVEAAREVMGEIRFDPCSDYVANKSIKALIYCDFSDDGFTSFDWKPKDVLNHNVFMNPPGESWTGGESWERLLIQKYLEADEREDLNNWLKGQSHIKRISAADWYRALYQAWLNGWVTRAVWVLYRGGSFGSLGKAMLQDSVLCLTAAGAESDCINGSGRLAFETVDENDQRVPQTSNTQSSIIGYLPARANLEEERAKFCKVFSQFGVCK